MKKSFGKWLRHQRNEKKMSQRSLASDADINWTYLSKVENSVPGFSSLSEKTLKNMAKSLKADPDEMITRAGKIPSDVQQALVDDFSLVKEIRARKKVTRRRKKKDPKGSTGGSQ
ncbi:uncharacterized protein METZ01_LOCUS146277 [marine metagenome]|jgi:transcriptional regulator with XRE-family HTH domain|uniref:HTH cro/C1-type domain-containing protein n=1 Tax=marine metagenome TaxID=408172 RepID=A0A381ZXJ2_9ZZZZ|tara:strand:+ start:1131 stop:1475 length:345 start_codon:yes stop_codon:yes gene_type:complete